MNGTARLLFGAHAQVAIGTAAFVVGCFAWGVGTIRIKTAATYNVLEWSDAAYIFHVSMFFGLVACYAIVATGLGYRATERVEQFVRPDCDDPE